MLRSRLAMDVVALYTVQRAGCWKTAIMVQRYAHLSPDHMRAAVERLANAAPTTLIPGLLSDPGRPQNLLPQSSLVKAI